MTRPQPLVCHIIYRLAVGGLENGLVNLVNNLPETDYRQAIVCVTEATDFAQRISRPGVEIREVHKGLGKDIPAYARMWHVLRELRPTIVHTRNLPALDMLLPARLAGIRRFVHSEHGLDTIELGGRNVKYNRLRWASQVLVDRYLTVSHDLNNWLSRDVGIPAAKTETIYNGVDTVRFTPDGPVRRALPNGFAPDGTVVVGTIGRLDTLKNQIGLARAFGCMLKMRPTLRQSLRLVIVGDGKQRSDIEAALAEVNARDLAWLPGFRNDTAEIYRSLDIFVLPSFREGISNTLLEAMASGRPVIAARVGGNPEIVPDGIAGMLVTEPSEQLLARAILEYIDNPGLMRRHGEGARAHVLRSFSLVAMVQSYDRVYRSLL